MDKSGLKGAQNKLYSSVWAPQRDQNHFWETMVLTRFEPFVVLNWPIFKVLLALGGAKMACNGRIPLVCAPQIAPKYLWKNTFLIHF